MGTGGRQTKLNATVQKLIVEALKNGCLIKTACEVVGIDSATYRRWMTRGRSRRPRDRLYHSFRTAVKRARRHGEVHALRIIQEAMPKSWQAAAWYLERSQPRRWGRVDRSKVTVRKASDFNEFYPELLAIIAKVYGEAEPAEAPRVGQNGHLPLGDGSRSRGDG